MKLINNRITIILCLLQTSLLLHSQSADKNYVLTRTSLDTSGMNHSTAITYYDGLGRAVQTATDEASGDGSFQHTLVDYDGAGRLTYTFLPVGGDGTYINKDAGLSARLDTHYGMSSAPFCKNVYDGMGRIVEVKQPSAASAATASIKKRYIANDSKSMPLLMLSGNTSLTINTGCQPNLYIGEITTDEDGNETTVWRNRWNEVVYSTDGEGHSTAYLYNSRGLLTFVLPPAALSRLVENKGKHSLESSDILKDYAYHYDYDARGHCVKKKLPGCTEVTMAYDAGGRLFIECDGNQKKAGRQTIYLYDDFGRIVLKGECAADYVPPKHFNAIASYTGNGTYGGYTPHMQLPEITLLQVIYYDNYDYLECLTNEEKTLLKFTVHDGFSQTYASATGFVTGQRDYYLDASAGSNIAAMYYDIEGRMIGRLSSNHLGGAEEELASYSFTGKPLKIFKSHTSKYSDSLAEETFYTYDSKDRLISETMSVNNGEAMPIASYSYDRLGRVLEKTIGGKEKVKFSYHIRNWPVKISSNKFTEWMAYDGSCSETTPAHPLRNGNISAIEWSAADSNGNRHYNFTYDKVGRLTDADYSDASSSGTGRFNEKVQYDCMGNALSVQRNGKFRENVYGPIDDLTMEYEGNRLVKADDAVDGPYYTGAFHFVDRADVEEEYSYDANGNVTSDLNKNIARIDYNCLNLPTMIRFGDGSKYMSMKYDAAGRLLRRTTRVPFEDIAVSGKLQQVTAKADLSALSSRLIARNGAASAAGTAGASSGSSAASPSLAPSTTLQGTQSSVSSSVVPAISGKVSMRTFGMTDYDYCGNVEYTNDKAVLYHSEGYVKFDKNQQPEFHYYLKDHLGNVRVVFNERDSVEQVTHYYPFGGSFGDGVGSSVQDYLYSGKELTRFNALNWYNFGARWYDPTIARWNGVDNMAENYLGCSPYIYCGNNPISRIDVDGNDWYITGSGNIVYNPSVHSQEDIGSKDQERGYKYLGESWTDEEKGIQYRRDGSILFSNEKDAYNRMWYFANKHWRSKKYPAGKENSAFILSDGRVLVLPDFNNDSHTSKMYGYRWKGNELLGPNGFKEEFTAQVHTHQTGDCAPSHVVGVRDDDDFCFNMPNKAMFVLAHDGNLYGMYYSTKRHGIETFNNKPIGTITNVLKGYTSLFFTSKIIIK